MSLAKLTFIFFALQDGLTFCNKLNNSDLAQSIPRYGELQPIIPVPDESKRDKITWGWFENKVDHFNSSDTRTWSQRYLWSSTYAKPGGPGFLKFSGESTAGEGFLQTNNGTTTHDWMRNAKIYGATAFILEHRGAGNDASKMVYLTSRQALADAAEFLKWASKDFKIKKWVAFGGSYSGTLAAFFRLKYPDLVVGAVSSSGGIQAVVEYSDYYEVAGNDLLLYDQRCYDETAKIFAYIQSLIDEGREDYLRDRLRLCHGIVPGDEMDLSALFDNLNDPWFQTCQYGGDNRAPNDVQTIPALCKIVMDTEKYPDLIDRFLAVRRFTKPENPAMGTDWQCMDNSYSEQFKESMELNSGRGWNWLCCNEFGWLQPSDAPVHPFGRHSSMETRYKNCHDNFGITREEIRRRIDKTNTFYGGQQGFNATNVVIINGSQDPFYRLGVWNPEWEKSGQKIIFMKGQAHCSDMYVAFKNDTQLVKDARKIITEEIGKWLDS